MRAARASRTAEYVAAVRAVLTANGDIDDSYARSMLGLRMRAVVAALRVPPLRSRTRSGFFAALAARTLFVDGEVARALDDGLSTVVTIGAGYDSRAWRCARSGAHFVEVDHPATQAVKRRRAPAEGPTYVAVDLETTTLADALGAAGFNGGSRALFVVEGVTMYLDVDAVHGLLVDLARAGGAGSRLAVNFAAPRGSGVVSDRWRQAVLRVLGRAVGEQHLSAFTVEEAADVVDAAGWRVDRATTLRELGCELLAQTDLNVGGINPEAPAIAASRPTTTARNDS